MRTNLEITIGSLKGGQNPPALRDHQGKVPAHHLEKVGLAKIKVSKVGEHLSYQSNIPTIMSRLVCRIINR
jgi:hypothetical protein